jgi:two-component system copper resistance phosphate regulon response regulator CusR
MRILLVEDDDDLRHTVATYLRASGFAVDAVATGKMALEHSAVSPCDAIVLDIRLPDTDGYTVCRTLRARGDTARVLMATARDSIEDRIAGLDGGADDYIVKPYALGELVARLRALLRRPADALAPELQVDDLRLDTATRRAFRGARPIALTTKEFAVLEVLMRLAGTVVTRERLSRHAWDDNHDPASNVIDVYIARLRRKIDMADEAPLLETVRGAGYRLGAPAAVATAHARS